MKQALVALLISLTCTVSASADDCELRERFTRAMIACSLDWYSMTPPDDSDKPITTVKLDPTEEDDDVNLIEVRTRGGGIIRVRIEELKDRFRQAELDAQTGFRHISVVPRLVPRHYQLKDDIKWDSAEDGFHWWAAAGQSSDGLNYLQVIQTGHANERHEFVRGGFGWKW